MIQVWPSTYFLLTFSSMVRCPARRGNRMQGRNPSSPPPDQALPVAPPPSSCTLPVYTNIILLPFHSEPTPPRSPNTALISSAVSLEPMPLDMEPPFSLEPIASSVPPQNFSWATPIDVEQDLKQQTTQVPITDTSLTSDFVPVQSTPAPPPPPKTSIKVKHKGFKKTSGLGKSNQAHP